jgi:hypothetical protein
MGRKRGGDGAKGEEEKEGGTSGRHEKQGRMEGAATRVRKRTAIRVS